MITIKQYKKAVIKLFKSGKATKKQWEEMTRCVLDSSESDNDDTYFIDAEILGPVTTCEYCKGKIFSKVGYCDICG